MECDARVMFFILFSVVILLAGPIDGRKGPVEYWAEMMKDQPIPEAFTELLGLRPNEVIIKEEQIETSSKNFDPIPNISVYHDDASSKETKSEKPDCNSHHDGLTSNEIVDDFEPRPTISAYKEFESRPTISAYKELEPRATISAYKEFESRPTISAYKELEPRPTISAYKEFESRPTISAYKEFESRPTISAYKEFESRPTISAYKELESRPTISAYKEFESRPTVTAYKEFEPRPTATAYND